jgi:hypothetical protein
MHAQTVPAPWMQYVFPALVLGLVVGIRLWRMRGARRLRLETLWILPAIYIVFVIGLFATHPPGALGFAASGVALLAGGGIGWYRGTMMRINVDPETHMLSQQASPLAVLLLFGLLVVRRVAMAEMGHAQIAIDALMAFALGLIAVTRLEMFLRARRLLREARSGSLSKTFS